MKSFGKNNLFWRLSAFMNTELVIQESVMVKTEFNIWKSNLHKGRLEASADLHLKRSHADELWDGQPEQSDT